MNRYRVWLFEPAVDPGGYEDQIDVEALTEEAAIDAAKSIFWRKWPDAGGLAVFEISMLQKEHNNG